MKLKNKTTLLAAAIALAGVTYLPSASASTTFLSDDDSVGYSSKVAFGSFTDFYDFSVNGGAFSINATGNSSTTGGLSKGTEITSFNLYNNLHNVIETGVVSKDATKDGWAFSSKFFKEPLLANTLYSIGVAGVEHNSAGGKYSVSFTVAPSAVPLPGAVWMMMTGIIGLFGYQARNKKTA